VWLKAPSAARPHVDKIATTSETPPDDQDVDSTGTLDRSGVYLTRGARSGDFVPRDPKLAILAKDLRPPGRQVRETIYADLTTGTSITHVLEL